MAMICFCGATGKMFRGRATPRSEWLRCEEAERPPPRFEGTDEERRDNCLECPLYLHGFRKRNDVPYRWMTWTGHGYTDHRILVAGGGFDKSVLLESRLECGRQARQQAR